MNNPKYFLVDNRTIMECEKEVTSLITFIPLKQTEEENMNEKEGNYNKRYEEKIKTLLGRLSTIDKKTGFFQVKTPSYGTVYKVINLFEKDTILQKGLIEGETTKDRLEMYGKEKEEESGNNLFLEKKLNLKYESISNENQYEKTSFLVIKTMWNNKLIVKTPKNPGGLFDLKEKETLYNRFVTYTKDKFLEDEDIIDVLKKNHLVTYEEIENNLLDPGVDINSSNLSEWIARLSLSESKTDFFDGDFINNNFYNESKGVKKVFKIASLKGGNSTKIIEIEQKRIIIQDPRKRNTRKVIKINNGEDYNIEKEVLQGTETGNYLLKKSEWKNGYKMETVVEKMEIKEDEEIFKEENKSPNIESFFVNGLPSKYKDNLSINLSKSILAEVEPESFVFQIELFRFDTLDLEKKYKSEIRGLSLLTILPSFGDLLYDKISIYEKQTALIASMEQLKLLDFTNIRISFGYKKIEYNPNDKRTVELKAKAQNLDKIIPIKNSFSELMLPWVKSDYITSTFAQDSIGEVSVNELVKLIDLKDGQQYVSRDKPGKLKDVEEIKKSSFFVKSKTTIQGIDVFFGPDKFNGLIIAPSGSGKSFFAVNMLDGIMGASPDNIVWILDRGGSFTRFTNIHGGVNKNIELSDKDSSINPFSLSFKTLSLMRLLEIENILLTTNNEGEYEHKLTKELQKEISVIVRMLQIYSDTSQKNDFRFLSNSSDELAAKKVSASSYDTFKLFLNEDGSIVLDEEGKREIETKFKLEEPQATLSVLSSIAQSMLTPDRNTTQKSTKGGLQQLMSLAPTVINNIFEKKYKKILNSNVYLSKYKIEETKKGSEIKEVPGNSLYIGRKLKTKERVKFQYDYEQDKIMRENIYFTSSELKQEFLREIDEREEINFNEVRSYLDALNFYIDMKEAGKLFNTKPPADLSREKLVNIDLGESKDPRLSSVVPAAILMNFFKIMTSPAAKNSQKVLLIDEAHNILNAEDTSGLESIAYLFRTARKHGAAVWLISQSVSDFYRPQVQNSNVFDALRENAGWRVLLGGGHQNTEKAFTFSEPAAEFALKTKEGAERFTMLLDMQGAKTIKADLIVSGVDYWSSTTHKAEKVVLDVWGSIRDGKTAIRIMAELFPDPSKGMRTTYNSIQSLIGIVPHIEVNTVIEDLEKRLINEELSSEQLSIVKKEYKLVKAILMLTEQKNIKI
jgi:hypothetical protein